MLLVLALTVRAEGDELGNFEWKGELGMETRIFKSDHLAATRDANLALIGRIEMDRRLSASRQRLRLFGRLDPTDSGRNLPIIEEAWAEYRWSQFKVRAGFDLVNWSATEAFHPADVINSRNLDSDLESFEKLGEPMLMLSQDIPAGELIMWYLPIFIEPIFPSERSRLSPLPPGLRAGDAIWVSRDGLIDDDHFAHQWAIRFSQSRGPVDFDLHALQHIDRHQPVLRPDPQDPTTLRPIYLPVTQVGGTVQAVLADWLAKMEWAWRGFKSLTDPNSPFGRVTQPDHVQVAFGLEYNLAHDSGAVSTFVLEGQTLAGVDESERAALHPFQRDLLVGYRHAFNDPADKELRASLIFDVERRGELLFNLGYGQRLSDTLSLRAGLRLFHAPQEGQIVVGLERFDPDDYAYLSLIYRL